MEELKWEYLYVYVYILSFVFLVLFLMLFKLYNDRNCLGKIIFLKYVISYYFVNFIVVRY